MNDVYVYAAKQESLILSDIINIKDVDKYNVSVRIGADDRFIDLSEPSTYDENNNPVSISAEDLLDSMRSLLNGDTDQPVRIIACNDSTIMISKLDADKFTVTGSFPPPEGDENTASNGVGVLIDTKYFASFINNLETAYKYTAVITEESEEE